MGIKYTPQQQQVIDVHGHNILVSAAAGSGKTAVLVERIVQMISDETKPVDIDRLLVVTFTNAAAAEMRERISAAIAARLQSEPENEHLQKQATLIHNAQITTIDSFCMFVIRNNFNDIGLDPGFRVADEGELKLLKQDVLEAMLEERFEEKSPSFLSCVEYFSTGSRDKMIEEHILKLYGFAESYPWPEEWLLERKMDYEVADLEELEQAPFIKFGMEQVRHMTLDCIRRMEDCIAICEQPDGPYMYGAVLEKEKERLLRLLRLTKYEEGYALFRAMSFDRLPSKKDESVSPMKRELVQSIRKEIKETVKEIAGKYFPASAETVLMYMREAREAVCELVNLTLAYKEALDKKKRDGNIIDFGDMEHLALSILVKKTDNGYEPTETALDYRAFFTEVLIDEYQDSNMVQEYLLKSISGEDEGSYNRFMVGDVKQSIYKFRLARPEIFMEKYDTYEADSETKQRIDLHKNFRSRKEILDGVNFIFSQIMVKSLGGVEYNEEAALYPGAAYPRQEAAAGHSPNAVELLLVKKPEEPDGKGESEAEGIPADNKAEAAGGAADVNGAAAAGAGQDRRLTVRQREALAVAKRIKELVKHFQVTDKETGALRPACYKDIVILLRTNAGWDEEFRGVLKEEGIPSHAASKTGYFAAKEVQTLLQLLRILDNPQQDIPLFGVLKSYFGGLEEEEIACIRAASKERNCNLYYALKGYGRREGETEDASEAQAVQREGLNAKINTFLAFLEEYRDKTIYMPIHELIREIVTKTGYLHYVMALPGGEQRRANVEILLEKASSFEQTSYYGLFHFIRYIEQLEKYDVDYGEANILDENADVVRIMSIHRSKGLEFPICFVCGLAKRFNRMDTNGKMIADVDMGIGVDYVDIRQRLQSRTLRKNVIAEKLRLDNLGEELRVLYVALTRAKEKLIMTGVIDKPETKLSHLLSAGLSLEPKLFYSDLARAGSFLDFILPALCRHRAFAPIWKEFGYEYGAAGEKRGIKLYAEEAELIVEVIGDEALTAAGVKEAVAAEDKRQRLRRYETEEGLSGLDNELLTYMSEVFAYEYAHSDLADLYTKTTVSELKKAGQEDPEDFSFRMYEEEKIVPYIPKFMKEEETLSGAGRGSAFHKVMELWDFAKLRDEAPGDKDIQAAVDRMAADGTLREEYKKAVSVPAIGGFLRTKLARRMEEAARKQLLYKEQPFVLGLPANELKESFPEEELVLIQGIIDVYFEEGEELVVADYKTDRVGSPEELAAKYKKQLDYYAKALTRLTGKRVKEKIIYSFALQKEIML